MISGTPWRNESFPKGWLRRGLTIPAYALAGSALLAALPILLLVAAPLDVFMRRRFALTRSLLLAAVYFLAELAGIVASAMLWMRHAGWRREPSEDYLAANYRLQAWWAGFIFGGARRILRLRVRVSGQQDLERGPIIVLARHCSPLDNLVPAVFVAGARRIRLRWVINRWLLRDPCLDIVGNRLPNVFVAARSTEPRGQGARITALAAGLGSGEGVLIYPEGALFNPQRVARALSRTCDIHAAAFAHVLPPRGGAVLATLEALPEADVILCRHTGLEAAGDYRSFLTGALVGKDVIIEFVRIPRSSIPEDAEGRLAWLRSAWHDLDAWLAVRQT